MSSSPAMSPKLRATHCLSISIPAPAQNPQDVQTEGSEPLSPSRYTLPVRVEKTLQRFLISTVLFPQDSPAALHPL